MSSIDALKAHIESGQENPEDTSEAPYPRWVRINTLKTTLEDQLETTFAECGRATTVNDVRQRDSKQIYIDVHIPNLVAVSPCVDLLSSEAYKSGAIIFQDKASCFPAYLLDPLAEDGDIIDTCSAPGNKTTHIAAILLSHNPESEDCRQAIHAFEKNKVRAKTLEKMVNLAGSDAWTTLHPGQDFLKASPGSPMFKDVGALLLDPSCSGSGIIGRDDMPPLHLPVLEQSGAAASAGSKKTTKRADKSKETTRKRKREEDEDLTMVDDDGVVTTVDTGDELETRLTALSAFQLDLLLHAFKFPAARKITYSTCSVHSKENESVVQSALASEVAKQHGWRILKRDEQIRGMREWPVRGSVEDCGKDKALAEACIRANKGDEHGTMGFFLAGFVRDAPAAEDADAQFLRDERGHLVRDLLGFPVRVDQGANRTETIEREMDEDEQGASEEEWNGFSDDENLA